MNDFILLHKRKDSYPILIRVSNIHQVEDYKDVGGIRKTTVELTVDLYSIECEEEALQVYELIKESYGNTDK